LIAREQPNCSTRSKDKVNATKVLELVIDCTGAPYNKLNKRADGLSIKRELQSKHSTVQLINKGS